jgi:hypothetical protein
MVDCDWFRTRKIIFFLIKILDELRLFIDNKEKYLGLHTKIWDFWGFYVDLTRNLFLCGIISETT